jgi:hypothetical protein
MKNISHIISILTLLFLSCHKDPKIQQMPSCDIKKAYVDNALKITITTGIWGTVAFMEGDCMPVVPPTSSTCKTCPVKRTVRIYEYTRFNQAIPQNGWSFYDNFTTQLIKELDTDNNGFFEAELAPGNYTIIVLENGKLYTFGLDGQGGLSPVNFTGGKQNVNLTLTYKAAF